MFACLIIITDVSSTDEGIYSFYTTNNSVTQYDSINLYSGSEYNFLFPILGGKRISQNTFYSISWLIYDTNNNLKKVSITKYIIVINRVSSFLLLFDMTDKTEKLSNYVIVRHNKTLDSSIPYLCCKYGFSVLENESFVNFVNLLPNESAHFAVFPTFVVNNNSIAIVKPWISYEGNELSILLMKKKIK